MNRWHRRDGRRSFLHDAAILVGNQFVVMGIGMLGGVVLARLLGAAGRGLIAAATVYPAIFLSFCEMGVRQSAAYHLGKKLYTNAQVVGAISALVLIVGSVGAAGCAGMLAWMDNPAITPLIVVLAVLPFPFSIFTSYSSGIFLGNRRVGQFAAVAWLAAVLNLAALIGFLWVLDWGVPGALLATWLSGLVVAGYAAIKTLELASLRPRFEWTVVRNLLVKGVVYALALFVITLNYRVNVIVLERLSSVAEIGVFALGVSVAQLTWALPQAITTALFSHSATAPDENEFSGKVQRLFRISVLVAGLLVVGLGVASPVLVPLVYGKDFTPSVRVIHLLLPGVFAMLGLKILNMDLAGRGLPNASLWAMVPALAINAATSIVLVPRLGAQGAAIASSIAYVAGGVGMVFVYCRYVGIGWGELWRYRRTDFSFLERWRRTPRAEEIAP